MKVMVALVGIVAVAGLAMAPGPAVAQIAKNVAAKSPWGPGDEIGTLNMMTDASRFDVLKQIAGGKVYDLGVDLFVGMPNCCGPFGDPTFQIWMTHIPARDTATELLSYSGDAVSMYTHSGTHLDTLNHFGLHGKIWNQVSAEDALSVRGWTKSGADKYPPIVARGVLIDVAKSKNLAHLPASYSITAADLQEARRQFLESGRRQVMPGAQLGRWRPLLRRRDEQALVLIRDRFIRQLHGSIRLRSLVPSSSIAFNRPYCTPATQIGTLPA